MSSYYCLMAGLPDIALDDGRGAQSVAGFKAELAEVLTHADKELMFYFYLRYDCLNLVKLLQFPEAEISPLGNYSREQYEDMMTSAREMNFNVHRYPSFLSIFARDYAYNKDKEGYFPEDAILLGYYEYALKCPNRMLREWFSMNLNVTNILTALIAKKYGWNVADFIQGDNTVCEMIRNSNARDFGLGFELDYVSDLMKIVECEDPVEKEKRIDAFKWLWLDEQTFMDVFSIEAVFAYMCKLEMLERWEKLDVETGRETFRQIIENLRGEARVPEEFKR
ncbi:MAG: DUF2764 family protein [Bacteroidaceae bacterium]|nr:DUF2764 family protein [Bacteroidaceae bacterium]